LALNGHSTAAAVSALTVQSGDFGQKPVRQGAANERLLIEIAPEQFFIVKWWLGREDYRT